MNFEVNAYVHLPTDSQTESWPLGTPNEEVAETMVNVHEVISKIIELIPM